MHRVELKVVNQQVRGFFHCSVPNAPCGVESFSNSFGINFTGTVPNAPCGVERRHAKNFGFFIQPNVPNAPCGVERTFS